MSPRRSRALTALLTLGVLLAASTSLRASEESAFATTRYAPQNRPDVRGTHGAVVAGHPLAAQAGMAVLQRGGNATDATIAMAAVLAVVRPHMNGIGGDAFGLFQGGETGAVHALNGSGRSGALATPEFFARAGHEAVPGRGALSVSIPGAVAAWVDAHERFGSLPFEELLAPAIGYAREGFPVSTRLALDIDAQGAALDETGSALYKPGGAPPPVGSLLRNPELADSLETIAREGRAGYYEGEIAANLVAFLSERGGYLREADFAAHRSNWVEPLRGRYLGHEILVMPPNTQGIAQLQLMEMAKGFPLAEQGPGTAEYLHTLVELKKLAFADRDRWVADPEKAEVPVDWLLDPAYLRERADRVDPARAATEVSPGFEALAPSGMDPAADMGFARHGSEDDRGDTVYLTAVDGDGNAVSWIQSNFAGFGSGLVDPVTGILLHNRGALFTLEAGHPNRVAPGKRPYHTLTPMLARHPDGTFAFTLGTPGGDSQTQSLLQIVNYMLMSGMTPQEAVEAPRFRSLEGTRLAVEDRFSPEALDGLAARGHALRVIEGWTAVFGGAQMIVRDPDTGVLTAAADPRREAYAIAW